MATTDRFEIIAPLPSSAGFRRVLAVDRAGPPRAVVLAFAPARVADDPVRIAALARDAEAAARIRHPNVVPVDGLETVGGAMAIVEPHRPGPSLRDLLDAGGRLPPDLAARIVADACTGLARVHALDPGDGRPLAHGALAAERLVLGEDGATSLRGLGAGLGEDPAADVRALAAVLHECLTGEPPASPPRPLDSPGVPAALGAVVDLALGATGGQPLRSAAVLGEAIAAALPLAAREAVAAYVDAILPAAEGERAALTRLIARTMGEEAELVEELVEDGNAATPTSTPPASALISTSATPTSTPTPTSTATSTPAPTRSPVAGQAERGAVAGSAGARDTMRPLPPEPVVIPARVAPAARSAPSPDTVSVFPAPVPAAPRRSLAPFAIAAACAVIGFGAGFAATRGKLLPDLFREDVAERQPPPAVEPPPSQVRASDAAVAAPGAAASAAQERSPAAHEAPVPSALPPKPSRARPERKPPARRVAAAAAKGFLVVTAPAEAEVLLDGKRIGKGDVRLEVDAGAHRVEVRLGEARVTEQFTLTRGETWTYDVTPTGN